MRLAAAIGCVVLCTGLGCRPEDLAPAPTPEDNAASTAAVTGSAQDSLADCVIDYIQPLGHFTDAQRQALVNAWRTVVWVPYQRGEHRLEVFYKGRPDLVVPVTIPPTRP